MVFENLAKIIAEYKDIDASEITPETTLADLGLDSLDMVELMMSVEEQIGVEIKPSETTEKVSDIVDLIEASEQTAW